jgi:hypothetical protein
MTINELDTVRARGAQAERTFFIRRLAFDPL